LLIFLQQVQEIKPSVPVKKPARIYSNKAADKKVYNITKHIHVLLYTTKLINLSIFSIFSENKISKSAYPGLPVASSLL
jgi:hypothetical protein